MYRGYPAAAPQKPEPETGRRPACSARRVFGRAALHGPERLHAVSRLDLVLVDDGGDDGVADAGVRGLLDRRRAATLDVDPPFDGEERQRDRSFASVHERTTELVDGEAQILDVLDGEAGARPRVRRGQSREPE